MKKLVTSLMLLFVVFSARAQWTDLNGPTGDGVTGLEYAGSDLLLSTYNGVFRSSDQGVSWVQASGDLRGILIHMMTRWQGALFAFSDTEDRLFRSDDDGSTWTEVPFLGFPFPIATAHQLTATNSALFLTTPTPYRSVDGGQTWEALPTPFPLTYYYTRLVAQGDVLYLIAPDAGIFRSIDQGSTWDDLTTGLSKKPYRGFVYDGKLVAVFYSGGWKVYQSDNNGQSWTLDNSPGLQLSLSDFGVHNGRLYGISGSRIWSRPVDGATWQIEADVSHAPFMASSNVPVAFRAKFFSGGSRLFATSYFGIFYSDDMGKNWAETENGLLNIATPDILLTPDAVLCAGRNNLYRYDQSSAAWSLQDDDIPLNTAILNLSEAKGMLYAGGWRGLWRSEDQGLSWNKTAAFPIDYYKEVIPMGDDLLAGSTWGVYRSADNGLTWEHSAQGMEYFDVDVYVYPNVLGLTANGDTVLAHTYSGIFRSVDKGFSWSLLPLPLAYQVYRFGQQMYWLTTNNNAFVSTDMTGSNLLPVDFGHPDPVRCMALFQGVLFAGTKGGILLSKDDGVSWVFYGNGMPTNLWVSDLEIDDAYVYAGTAAEGVWRIALSEIGLVSTAAPDLGEADFGMRLYPNPTSTEVWLDLGLNAGETALIQVFDSRGILIYEWHAQTGQVRLSASSWPEGIYNIRATRGSGRSAVGRVVVRH